MFIKINADREGIDKILDILMDAMDEGDLPKCEIKILHEH